jgi:hypothetical protein
MTIAAASTSWSGRGRKLVDEFRADFSGRGQPVCTLKMAKSAPGGVVFGTVGLDRISEHRQRDPGGAHQMQFIVDGLAAQERADLVGRRRPD